MALVMGIWGRYIFAAMLLLLASITITVSGDIATAYTVEVSVDEAIRSDVKSLSVSADNNFAALDYEVFDSGSTGYGMRLRADIYNNTPKGEVPVATIWTKEMTFEPGERKHTAIYWQGRAGNFTVKTKAYRAQEIQDIGQAAIVLKSTATPENIFAVEKIRTYDDKIKMRLKNKSSKDARGVVIYPAAYPAGWLFEQEYAGELAAGESRWITMRYEPALFSERSITLAVAGNGGQYYGEQAAGLRKEAGLLKYLHLFEDSLF